MKLLQIIDALKHVQSIPVSITFGYPLETDITVDLDKVDEFVDQNPKYNAKSVNYIRKDPTGTLEEKYTKPFSSFAKHWSVWDEIGKRWYYQRIGSGAYGDDVIWRNNNLPEHLKHII